MPGLLVVFRTSVFALRHIMNVQVAKKGLLTDPHTLMSCFEDHKTSAYKRPGANGNRAAVTSTMALQTMQAAYAEP